MANRKRHTFIGVIAATTAIAVLALLVYVAFVRVWSMAHPPTSAGRDNTAVAPSHHDEDITTTERQGLDDVLKRKAAPQRQ